MNMIPIELCDTQLELFGYTQCANCDALILQEAAEVVTYYNHTEEQQHEHFCGLDCKYKWHVRNLQSAGM